ASAVTWAFTLMLMPQAAIAQSAGTASLPTLSAQYELGQHDTFRKTLSGIIRAVLLLAIPATVAMIILRVPLIQVIYERGQFDANSTAMVSWALLWYGAGLVGHCLVEVLSRGYYAMHDTRTPVIVGVLAMGLNIALSFLFVRLFIYMPHGGLALANSVATALESIVLLIILRKRLEGLEGKQLFSATWKSLLASAVMAGVIWAWMRLMIGQSKYLVLLGGGVLGLLAYGLMIWLLKVPELRTIITRIKQKLGEAG
nr:lipid II flippase MurJ [Anaerolineaceae bacterium]